MSESLINEEEIVLVIVADTHIPDRCHHLPEHLLSDLKDCHPDLILHAGDITTLKVIQQFEEVAPVVMVRGNRDFVFFPHVPRKKDLYFHDVQITLLHGHANLRRYLINKVRYLLFRFNLDWFLSDILEEGKDADVIIFGHTHRPLNTTLDGQLLFNPGSITVSPEKGVALSYGVLRISAEGDIQAEIVEI
ncbi:MAG: YfcE family phosphodiesterase [Anaerolineaceae bacterium]|nr:YfcE family phosphodiesterase [Anaerolineaceae bacterium]